MSPTQHPTVERYLKRFEKELSDLPEDERVEVVGEIRNHAAEAMRSGDDAADVLERLGSPDKLARAYRIELALEGRQPGTSRTTRAFTIIGVAAVASLPSFVVVVTLGSVALGFTGGGVLAALAGIASLLLPGTFIESTLPIPHVLSELLAVGVGIGLTVAGIVAAILLYFYVRTLARAFGRVMRDLKAARA